MQPASSKACPFGHVVLQKPPDDGVVVAELLGQMLVVLLGDAVLRRRCLPSSLIQDEGADLLRSAIGDRRDHGAHGDPDAAMAHWKVGNLAGDGCQRAAADALQNVVGARVKFRRGFGEKGRGVCPHQERHARNAASGQHERDGVDRTGTEAAPEGDVLLVDDLHELLGDTVIGPDVRTEDFEMSEMINNNRVNPM